MRLPYPHFSPSNRSCKKLPVILHGKQQARVFFALSQKLFSSAIAPADVALSLASLSRRHTRSPCARNETNGNMTICGIACYNRKLEIITQLGYGIQWLLLLLLFGIYHLSFSVFVTFAPFRLCGSVWICASDAKTTIQAAAAFRMWHSTSVKSHIHFEIRLILMTMIFYATDSGGFRRVYLNSSSLFSRRVFLSLFLCNDTKFNPIHCNFAYIRIHLILTLWNSFLLPMFLSLFFHSSDPCIVHSLYVCVSGY